MKYKSKRIRSLIEARQKTYDELYAAQRSKQGDSPAELKKRASKAETSGRGDIFDTIRAAGKPKSQELHRDETGQVSTERSAKSTPLDPTAKASAPGWQLSQALLPRDFVRSPRSIWTGQETDAPSYKDKLLAFEKARAAGKVAPGEAGHAKKYPSPNWQYRVLGPLGRGVQRHYIDRMIHRLHPSHKEQGQEGRPGVFDRPMRRPAWTGKVAGRVSKFFGDRSEKRARTQKARDLFRQFPRVTGTRGLPEPVTAKKARRSRHHRHRRRQAVNPLSSRYAGQPALRKIFGGLGMATSRGQRARERRENAGVLSKLSGYDKLIVEITNRYQRNHNKPVI
mgnify:CR=1 FL=1